MSSRKKPSSMSANNPPRGGNEVAGAQSHSTAGVPLLYADTVVDIQYGVFTTKVIFGIEGPNQPTVRVGALVIPTAPLLNAARHILTETGGEDFQAFYRDRIEAALSLMKEPLPTKREPDQD